MSTILLNEHMGPSYTCNEITRSLQYQKEYIVRASHNSSCDVDEAVNLHTTMIKPGV